MLVTPTSSDVHLTKMNFSFFVPILCMGGSRSSERGFNFVPQSLPTGNLGAKLKLIDVIFVSIVILPILPKNESIYAGDMI